MNNPHYFFRFLFVFNLWSLCLFSQENATTEVKPNIKVPKFIGVEAGFEFMTSEIPDYDFIRGDIDYFGSGSSTSYLESMDRIWYTGIKGEIRTKNDKIGLLAGVRYIKSNSYISSSYDSDYFYFLHQQNEQTAEFLRIKMIDQYSEYIGIPIELRYLPFRPRLFRLYFEIGAEFNYLLSSTKEVNFFSESMGIYKNEVLSKFDDPSNTYTSVHFAIGWNLNWDYKTKINLEAIIPSLFISDYTTGLINPVDGIGLQLNVQVPF